MQNFDKIYPCRIDVSNISEKFVSKLKKLFRQGFPCVWWLAVIGVILLFLQALAIGIADRLGVSPKTSFLFSSFVYVLTFGFLAIIGGIKIAKQAQAIDKPFLPETNI